MYNNICMYMQHFSTRERQLFPHHSCTHFPGIYIFVALSILSPLYTDSAHVIALSPPRARWTRHDKAAIFRIYTHTYTRGICLYKLGLAVVIMLIELARACRRAEQHSTACCVRVAGNEHSLFALWHEIYPYRPARFGLLCAPCFALLFSLFAFLVGLFGCSVRRWGLITLNFLV